LVYALTNGGVSWVYNRGWNLSWHFLIKNYAVHARGFGRI